MVSKSGTSNLKSGLSDGGGSGTSSSNAGKSLLKIKVEVYCGFTSPLGRVTPGHNGFCSYQTTLLKGFYLRKILIVGKLLNYKVKTWKNSIIRRILVNYLIFIWLVSFLWIKLWPVLFIQLLYLSGPRTLHSYNKKFRIFFITLPSIYLNLPVRRHQHPIPFQRIPANMLMICGIKTHLKLGCLVSIVKKKYKRA